MPLKIKMALVLLAVGLVNSAHEAFKSPSDILTLIMSVLLMLGLLRGSEWARKLLLILSALSLLACAVLAVFLASPGAARQPGLGNPFDAAFWVVVFALIVWSLSSADVKDWLKRRPAGTASRERQRTPGRG